MWLRKKEKKVAKSFVGECRGYFFLGPMKSSQRDMRIYIKDKDIQGTVNSMVR